MTTLAGRHQRPDWCPNCHARTHPHCNHPACAGSWCSRAQCGWQDGSCDHHDRQPHPATLETVDGGTKATYKPVIQFGRFYQHPTFDNLWQAAGWRYAANRPDLPDWPEPELFAMWEGVNAAIDALPAQGTVTRAWMPDLGG